VEAVTLSGKCVRLEPLDQRHLDGLVAASAVDPSLYQWSAVPQGQEATALYIETAVAGRAAGTVLPFATVRIADGAVIGSTRFFDIERWTWPQGHPRHSRTNPDVCEIGYSWLTRPAIRTAANTEAKLLMLTYAFEVWRVLRICLHTDARNERSRAAMERMGGQFEGILRGHRMAADITPRDSARYSIIAADWPDVKVRLTQSLDRG
jgi:RimJ/RimL family protein N-acetyltransferase